uniref:NADH-ubiquinone oxidoreductase chain 4L n=1 Tax=Eulimnogammarus cyaneus TaxID=52945 RepID=A0A1L5BW39_9CRUS|nr:NADH dehydrogenase subunit 4L [Eulimnogammarus cyaneus]APL97178.1 NADH dehydrogenase subunit 4L [Eulimnogammarus cyaneus]
MMFYTEGSVGLGLVVGSLSFILNYGHLLSSLLSLEFLSLMIYWWLSVSSVYTGKDFFFALFYLVMVACEGVLGLSLLISSVYSHGVDYMKSYSTLSC